jgi:tetratricopeptide (TPR) repeat protein
VKKRKPIGRVRARRDYSWVLIFASVFVAYLPALNGGLLWDDLSHITFPELRSIGGLWRIWTELGATQQYYPLLHSAFWLEHRLWGDSMLGYHLANAFLHATAAWMVVLVLRQLAVPGALLAGLIFALHPVCVESVAWISEQKNTLSAVFYLASALVYLRFIQTGLSAVARTKRASYGVTRRSFGEGGKPCATEASHADVAQPFKAVPYWLAFALFICALLTKSVTATLPAALLVVVWWQRGLLEWRRDVLPLVPWLAIAAAAGAFTAWFEHQIIGAKGEAFDLTIIERMILAGRVIWFYLGKLFWPTGLIFVYPRWTIDATSGWQYLYPAAALALAIALAAIARRTTRAPLAGYLFFCGTLVPALGFVNVYPFVFSYVADHFQYLASLGIIVPAAAAATIAASRLQPSGRRAMNVAGLAAVVVLGVLTWHRSGVYQSAELLFRDTIARNPQSWMAYQNLGTELAARNRLPEAIDAFAGALQARPGYVQAKDNLVLAYMKLGDAVGEKPGGSDEAAARYAAVLRLDPNHFRANYNLGTILMDMPQKRSEAIAALEKAVTLRPESVEARVNLGILLADDPSRSAEAIAHLEVAIAKRPDLPVRELLVRLRSDAKKKAH